MKRKTKQRAENDFSEVGVDRPGSLKEDLEAEGYGDSGLMADPEEERGDYGPSKERGRKLA